MQSHDKRFVDFLQRSGKRFVIPVYQRNYDWKEEQCEQLLSDLRKVLLYDRKNHFFGSMVTAYHGNDEFLVIDGQQRLTTCTLLLLAMYHLIKDGQLVPKEVNLSERIYEEYLVNKWQEGENRLKLKSVKGDRMAYTRLFDREEPFVEDSNITLNYKYFSGILQRESDSVDALFEAITRLTVIEIEVMEGENPQLIFESLNSTGLALSEGDKIRNFILMGESTRNQEIYYEKYWNPIEVATKSDVSAFIRDYLSVKTCKITAIDKVYLTFKDFVDKNHFENKTLLEELLVYARRYALLLQGNSENSGVNGCIFRLNRLEITVVRPFFLKVLELQTLGVLQETEVEQIFLTVEYYIFRRSICGFPSNVLNKVFLHLHRDILRYTDTTDHYLEKFYYTLLTKKESYAFPEDDVFVEEFSTRSIYQMNRKHQHYILERLENQGTKEDKDVYRHLDSEGEDSYTIEHIMPQKLTPIWMEDLGTDYEVIHQTWKDRIANLTLTAYNIEYSNHCFSDKKTVVDGYLVSGIRMNQWISKKEQWTLVELEERNGYLMELALKIWKRPEVTFQPEKKLLEHCSLEDHVTLTHCTLKSFSYQEYTQAVNSWAEMLEAMVLLLHRKKPYVLRNLAKAKEGACAGSVSTDSEKFRGKISVEDEVFVNVHTSTQMKLSLLRRLFDTFREKQEDLVFYFAVNEEE